jgi:transposase
LDERRLRAAAEARSHGWGGIAAVARASGIAENTIRKELRELDSPGELPPGRVRRPGAGPKRRADTDPTLLVDLERLLEGETRGDPERPLLWTSKSVRTLARELRELGHEVSYRTVARLLHQLGYSLQTNRKTREGRQHPDRGAQFRHINERLRGRNRRGGTAAAGRQDAPAAALLRARPHRPHRQTPDPPPARRLPPRRHLHPHARGGLRPATLSGRASARAAPATPDSADPRRAVTRRRDRTLRLRRRPEQAPPPAQHPTAATARVGCHGC